MNYEKLVEALLMGADYGVEEESVGKLYADAADAIEELEKERDYYKRQYENRQRLIKCALGEEWT